MKSPEQWARIEAILDELLELPPAERRARLDQLAAGDAPLRNEVLNLLVEDEETRGPLDQGLDELARSVMGDGENILFSDAAGRRIGPYRTIRELGRGGMGDVFLAERADGQFEQNVALKIVRGVLREDQVERFRHERQILARLRHPNIAVLHDGGATEEGLPYFAMEYVDGDRITTWCDSHRLDVEARLVLFEAVCRAVQHAHRNLVIHRDLKPGNVFVTSDGTVKLLDFGIAKLIDPADGGDTQTTTSFFTPAYASPEQIQGYPTSTATDIWSLGVLLFELLTGRHPHGGDTRSSLELARSIVDDDAPSASVALAQTEPGRREELAKNRATDPVALQRRLRGDLDNILHKALRRIPEERYASAEDLRADLERYQRSLPVSARPATAGYRLRKLVDRHRLGTAAAAVALLAVVAGVIGIAWQARVAARERDRARAEARRALAVKDYLLEVFSAADPSLESGETITATELVERGASRIGSRFAGDPEVRAEITQTLGEVMRSLARYDRADTLLAAALADYRRLDRPEGIVTAMAGIGEVAVGRADHDRAVSLLEEALDLAVARVGPDHPATARVWASLGVARFSLGEHAAAESAHAEAIRIARSAGEPNRPRVAEYLLNLAVSQHDRGDRASAEASTREALGIQREIESGGGVGTARVLISLSKILDEMDRLEESQSTGREGLALLRREYGERGHPELAIALSNLAGPVRKSGDLDLAEALQTEALDIFRRHLGDDHYYVARLLSNLSLTRQKRGDLAGAERLLEESVRIMTKQLGPRHRSLIGPLNNRANVLSELKRFPESEALYREALSIATELFGAQSLDASYGLMGLGSVCRKTRRFTEAEGFYRQALDNRRAALPAGHSSILNAQVGFAGTLKDLGRVGEAKVILDSVVVAAEAGLPATKKALDDARVELGRPVKQ